MKILFIGVGYFPFLTAGEKNFFYRLFPIIKAHADVTVFSLNDYPESILIQETSNGSIPVYCLKRPFHRHYERFYFESSNYIAYHHRHKPVREIIEKLTSVIIFTPKLRKIIREHDIQVIHFMDNFGPSMLYVKRILPTTKVTYSAANYDPRGRKTQYVRYLRLSLNSLDAAGVYTKAYLDILNNLGIRIPLFITRWGVTSSREFISQGTKQSIKTSLGVNESAILLLWSGYLQQIQETDFYKAIEVARKVVNQENNISFVFAFKPETYKEKYAEEVDERINVLTGIENFGEVLEAADFFFSPIADKDSTVSPPLTWIESMAKGTPIITTDIPGVKELVMDGINGFVAQDYDELPNTILHAINYTDKFEMSQRCIKKVEQEFDIMKSAASYLNMWRSLLNNE